MTQSPALGTQTAFYFTHIGSISASLFSQVTHLCEVVFIISRDFKRKLQLTRYRQCCLSLLFPMELEKKKSIDVYKMGKNVFYTTICIIDARF